MLRSELKRVIFINEIRIIYLKFEVRLMRNTIVIAGLLVLGYGVWIALNEAGFWSTNFSAFSEYSVLIGK